MEEKGAGATSAEKKTRFKKICVFCGSRAGSKPSFSDAAFELGKQLVERKIGLVYGGGSVGLMGLISQTVFNGGCHVLGVIPRALLPREISGQTVGELKIVADMHQRKSEMEKNSDAFIALPGGYGTMEELLEMIAWSQLGIHEKPVGLLNVDGYYNFLIALFDKGVEEGFIDSSARHIVVVAETAEELINKMEIVIRLEPERIPIPVNNVMREKGEGSGSGSQTYEFLSVGILFCRNMHQFIARLHPDKVGKWTNYESLQATANGEALKS